MPLQQESEQTEVVQSAIETESIVVRNHDQLDTRSMRIVLRSAEGDTVFDRTVTVAPLSTVSIQTDLDRGVYDVRTKSAIGTANAECLIGNTASEFALIETGNGIVSVVDGL